MIQVLIWYLPAFVIYLTPLKGLYSIIIVKYLNIKY